MIVKTNFGNFHGFKSLETFMRLENKKEVEILEVEHFTIKIACSSGKFSYQQILEILTRED